VLTFTPNGAISWVHWIALFHLSQGYKLRTLARTLAYLKVGERSTVGHLTNPKLPLCTSDTRTGQVRIQRAPSRHDSPKKAGYSKREPPLEERSSQGVLETRLGERRYRKNSRKALSPGQDVLIPARLFGTPWFEIAVFWNDLQIPLGRMQNWFLKFRPHDLGLTLLVWIKG